jgi:hypothetical protein
MELLVKSMNLTGSGLQMRGQLANTFSDPIIHSLDFFRTRWGILVLPPRVV